MGVNLDGIDQALIEIVWLANRQRGILSREQDVIAFYGEDNEKGQSKLRYLANELSGCVSEIDKRVSRIEDLLVPFDKYQFH